MLRMEYIGLILGLTRFGVRRPIEGQLRGVSFTRDGLLHGFGLG